MSDTDTEASIDAPITVTYKGFVDYAFAHWLDSLKTGQACKTLALLGPPGIGKSATAKALTKRMTDYVRQNPFVIFGVSTMKEAVKLLNEDRAAYVESRIRAHFYLDLDVTEEQITSLVKRRLARLAPLTKDDVAAVERLLDFSSMLPEDLNGLPFRDGDFTRYCPQEWAAELCGKYSFGAVVQDDLPAAAPAMHTAGRQMALERRIHEHRFAPGILIIVTGNRREDKSAAKTLPAHFRNSVCLLGIVPDLDEWKKWYGAQPHHDGIVSAFLTWKPGLLWELPIKNDKMGAFATPRQWASLGRQFQTANSCGSDMLLAISAGLVGKGNASTFCGFVEIVSQLVDPEKVFDNPQGALPNPSKMLDDPSKQIAMTMALGEVGAARWKKAKGEARKQVPIKLMAALAHVCEGVGEYSATGVQTFLDSGGNLTAVAKICRTHRGDPVIGVLLDHIKESLLGGVGA